MRKTLLAGAAIALTACQPTFTGPADGQKVAVIGDSITNSATDELNTALGDKNRWIQGIDGIDLADGKVELVDPAAASAPEAIVIELGVNSAREEWNSADLPHLEAVLNSLDSVPCVIWTVPTARIPSDFDAFGTGSIRSRIDKFQASLEKRLPAHPNQRLADFGNLQDQNPTWWASDGLHLSVRGQQALANFTRTQLAGC